MLLDEDFQVPMFPNETAQPAFTNWTYSGNNIKTRRTDARSDCPGEDHPNVTNQTLYFEYNQIAGYDLTNTWSTNDIYILRLKTSPAAWSGTSQRYITPSIIETNGTTLWTTTDAIPLYETSFERGNPWTPRRIFSWVVQATNFGGTPGEAIGVEITGPGPARGFYLDDVVLELTNSMPLDTAPPEPDPMTWDSPPVVFSMTNVTMTCTFATDASPYAVEFYFENTNTGSNSGWQSGIYGVTWTEYGLGLGTTNSYRVKARDISPNTNETMWSVVMVVTTPAPDTTPPIPDPMTWAVAPMIVDALNVYMVANTATDDSPLGVEYYFENTNTGVNSGWQDGTTWSEIWQDFDTPLTYRVKARDKTPNTNETQWSTGVVVTIPEPPYPGLFIDTGFQVPLHPDGTGDPFFVGWTPGGCYSVRADVRADGLPGLPATPNQAVHFSWNGQSMTYDTDHEWTVDLGYRLTLNASGQAWSGGNPRYIEPRIMETNGTVLWATSVQVPLYDAAFEHNPWTPQCTFMFEILGRDITNGTEGTCLRIHLESSGQRGMYVDNVRFEPFIPPSAGAIIIVQ